MRDVRAVIIIVLALTWRATAASGQTVTVVHNVNLRPDPSSEYTPIRLLAPSEPPLTLLDAAPESGYYHVRTSSGEEGYVCMSRTASVTSPTATPTVGCRSIHPSPA